MTATTKKKIKAQPIDANALDENTPIKSIKSFPTGYRYKEPLAILIRFETERVNSARKICAKRKVSFTEVVNEGLELLLYCSGKLKLEDIKTEKVLTIINTIYTIKKQTAK